MEVFNFIVRFFFSLLSEFNQYHIFGLGLVNFFITAIVIGLLIKLIFKVGGK